MSATNCAPRSNFGAQSRRGDPSQDPTALSAVHSLAARHTLATMSAAKTCQPQEFWLRNTTWSQHLNMAHNWDQSQRTIWLSQGWLPLFKDETVSEWKERTRETEKEPLPWTIASIEANGGRRPSRHATAPVVPVER